MSAAFFPLGLQVRRPPGGLTSLLREFSEHDIFQRLLDLSPGLEARILKASGEELHYIADMVRFFRMGVGSS